MKGPDKVEVPLVRTSSQVTMGDARSSKGREAIVATEEPVTAEA